MNFSLARIILTRLGHCASGYLVRIDTTSDSFDSKPTDVLDSACLFNRIHQFYSPLFDPTRFHNLKTDCGIEFMSCNVYLIFISLDLKSATCSSLN